MKKTQSIGFLFIALSIFTIAYPNAASFHIFTGSGFFILGAAILLVGGEYEPPI